MLGRIAKGTRTALVTGGGSGIGKELARQLAHRGYNLLLVSRNEERLRAAAEELAEQYGVQTSYYSIDLAVQDSAYKLYDYCKEQGYVIDLLVNDAGMFIYNDVLKCETRRIEDILNLHVVTLTLMCRLFGKDMAERGCGWILNLASYSKWMCWPGLSVYSASKNYVESFSKAFAAEMRESGVKVMAVSPAGVTTDLYGLPKKLQKVGLYCGILWTPSLIAKVTLNALFFGSRKNLILSIRSYVPGILNVVAIPILVILPRSVVWLARKMTKTLQR
ncbi:MAG: SDR family NAD(P)-dependent oxidoreductase [Rikenellaceae bacterium]|nr:SDR family NAD(P)-dependent oxidoreductase [Rikenellaceae bacterium]